MELIGYTSVQDKKKLLQSFNPKDSLWIVSDIKSRDFVREYIQKYKNLPPPAKTTDSVARDSWQKNVQRAQDFWSKNLFLSQPDITTISRPLLTFIYQEWAKQRIALWQRGPETGTILCQYMEMIAHLLQHPLKESLMEEWQSEKNTPALTKWQSLAEEFWNHLNQTDRKPVSFEQGSALGCSSTSKVEVKPNPSNKMSIHPQNKRELKIIETSWVSAFLIDRFPYSKYSSVKEIVFDLGFEMDPVEAELITQIADKIPTKVLVPSHLQKDQSEKSTPPNYKNFFQQGANFMPPAKKAPKPTSIQIKKWTTPLAEVKDISAYVSGLLQKGVPAHKISVIAPKIEDYWIFLKSHFKKENIPVNKSETVSLISFYETQLWLSTMWTHLSVIRYENMSALWAYKNPHQNFSQLKSNFYNVKEKEHWPSMLYKNQFLRDKNQLVSFKEFAKWALCLLLEQETKEPGSTSPSDKSFSETQKPSVLKLLKASLNDLARGARKITTPNEKDLVPSASDFDSVKMSLPYSSWLKLLESGLNNKELTIKKEASQGINCLSFNALSYLLTDFVYIAGLNEQNLKTNSYSVLSASLADSLTQNLGFAIKWEPVDNKLEQIVSHFMDQEHKEMVLSCATSDFEGLPLSPSFLWLKKAKEQGHNIQHFSTPQNTLWDQQQKASSVQDILQPFNISPARISLIQQSIEEDQGKKTLSAFLKDKVDKLTVSLLEDYTHCPFIFLAKKHFDLWDGPEKDMDMTALEKGILIHKLFETLILNQTGFEQVAAIEDSPPDEKNNQQANLNKRGQTGFEQVAAIEDSPPDEKNNQQANLNKRGQTGFEQVAAIEDSPPDEKNNQQANLNKRGQTGFEQVAAIEDSPPDEKHKQQDRSKEELTKNHILETIENLYAEQSENLWPDKSIKLHPLIWKKEKARLLKKALLFLKKEQENKKLFKDFKPLVCEKKYQCYWNLKTQSLEAEGDIAWTGKIDRIDSNQQAYHIIDYKGQLKTGSIVSAWLSQEKFQMAVYAQVIERGLADLPALPVLSALYLSYKDFNREGMALKAPAYAQLLGSPRKKSLISTEEKQAIFKKINQQIQKVILNMQAGHFLARPKHKKLCETCQWRKICRAPHLN